MRLTILSLVLLGFASTSMAATETVDKARLQAAMQQHIERHLGVDRLEDAFRRYPKSRGRIALEITETALLQRGDWVAKLLGAVRDTGVRIALDDFGTGYSSLSHVHEFPVDILKVDKSFVRGLGTRESDASRRQMAMIKATSSLAQELGIAVVAEGIEAAITSRILQENGIRLGQGYLFSPPMPPEAFKGWYLDCAQKNDSAASRQTSADLLVELLSDGTEAAGAGAPGR